MLLLFCFVWFFLLIFCCGRERRQVFLSEQQGPSLKVRCLPDKPQKLFTEERASFSRTWQTRADHLRSVGMLGVPNLSTQNCEHKEHEVSTVCSVAEWRGEDATLSRQYCCAWRSCFFFSNKAHKNIFGENWTREDKPQRNRALNSRSRQEGCKRKEQTHSAWPSPWMEVEVSVFKELPQIGGLSELGFFFSAGEPCSVPPPSHPGNCYGELTAADAMLTAFCPSAERLYKQLFSCTCRP